MRQIVPADRRLRHAALTLLYSRLPRGERERQLALALAAVDRGEMTLDDLLVALVDGEAVGAILAVRRPGGLAYLWPPATLERAGVTELADLLLRSVADRLDAAGVQCTQCLLENDDVMGRALVSSGGFPYATDVLFLTRSTATPPTDSPQSPLSAAGYDESLHADFVRIVERTYVGTLDCPELARTRAGEQALTSHRAAGHFAPDLWRIFRLDEAAVGVLLAVDHHDRDAREIVYLGVVPEARGRGFGRVMLVETLRAAQRAGSKALEVSVDANNRYALALYESLGFSAKRRLAVHLRFRSDSGVARVN